MKGLLTDVRTEVNLNIAHFFLSNCVIFIVSAFSYISMFFTFLLQLRCLVGNRIEDYHNIRCTVVDGNMHYIFWKLT